MPEVYHSREGTLGNNWSTNAPDDFDFTGDDEGYFPITRLRQQYVDYLSAKADEYEEAKVGRHYYHGSQYTPEQVETLRKRRQPIIVFNRTARKIDGIVGLIGRLRQDPKAYPTNPKNAAGAEIATQCVRSVLQANRWKFLDPWCAGQASVEGIAGVELKLIEGDHADPDVGMDFVFGDDFFYDPRSAKPDFSDARYMGIAKWLDVEAAVELFPEHEEALRTLMVETGFDLTTHADRENKWIYVNEKRLRLVEHWYRNKGKWYWCFYCSMILLEQGVSPFLDERRQPMSRFIMFSAAVDHDGDRYGHTRNLKGPQDELNQRRSKALHMSNVTAMYGEKGAVDDVETTRRERARPDGYIEYNKGFAKPEDINNDQDLGVQLNLMQDARQEIDSFANVSPNVLAQDDTTEHSGVAINLLQKAGIAELGSFFRNYSDWKERVYKATWNVCKRTWQAERFLRVTDNQGLDQFIQLNGMDEDQFGNPVIVNAIGELGVEIGIDDGPDTANLMQDAYDVLKQDPTVPWQIKVFFMPIQDSMKKQVMALINKPPDPLQQQQQQLTLMQLQAAVEDLQASAMERRGRTMTHVAHAAKFASEAQQTTQETIREGLGFAEDIRGQTGSEDLPQPQAPPGFGGSLGAAPRPQGPPMAPAQMGTFPGAPPRVLPQKAPPGPSFPQGA